jgi:hypothetical protein
MYEKKKKRIEKILTKSYLRLEARHIYVREKESLIKNDTLNERANKH